MLQIDERVPIEIYRSHEETRYVDDFSNSFPLSGLVHSGNELDPSLKFDLFVSSTATTTFTAIENPKSELDNYSKEKLLTRTHDFNILTWWKINGIKYPKLCNSARDILAIPESTMISEFAFCVDGKFLHESQSAPLKIY